MNLTTYPAFLRQAGFVYPCGYFARGYTASLIYVAPSGLAANSQGAVSQKLEARS